jgi:hypothetical protein
VTNPKDCFAAVSRSYQKKGKVALPSAGSIWDMLVCNFASVVSHLKVIHHRCFWYNQKCNKLKHKNLFPKSGQLHVSANIEPSSGRTTKLEEMFTAA